MCRPTTEGVNLHGPKSARRRLVEISLGLLFILLAIAVTRVWIELKTARRADSYALRRSVELTFQAADRYGLTEPTADEVRRTWAEYLDSPLEQRVPTTLAHEFLDSFLVSYQDGLLDSAEARVLYHQLVGFRPAID